MVRVGETAALASENQQGSQDPKEMGGSGLGPRTLGLLGRAR